MGRHAEKTPLTKKIFGKSSGWAKYGINTPSIRAYMCSDCKTAGVVLSNKTTGVVNYSTCDCVGDSQELIRVA